MQKILVGIQARSTSERLPGKIKELIAGKSMLDHVIDSAKSAATYLNRHSDRNGYRVDVALFMPEGDEAIPDYEHRCPVYVGSEENVLSRYYENLKDKDYLYLVRLTGDCPLIPNYVISKHIAVAYINKYDYLTNVHEHIRTSIDGSDCEVISTRALHLLNMEAKTPYFREHVTPYLRDPRRQKPKWYSSGFMVGYWDFSGMDFSVDTPEDLERVRIEYETVAGKLREADRLFGRRNVHRF